MQPKNQDGEITSERKKPAIETKEEEKKELLIRRNKSLDTGTSKRQSSTTNVLSKSKDQSGVIKQVFTP